MSGITLVEVIISLILVSGSVITVEHLQTKTLRTSRHGLYMAIAVTEGHNALAIKHMHLPESRAEPIWQHWQQNIASLLPGGEAQYSNGQLNQISIIWHEPKGKQVLAIDGRS